MRIGAAVRQRLAWLVARYATVLGWDVLTVRLAGYPGEFDMTGGLRALRDTFTREVTAQIVLDPSRLDSSVLPQLVLVTDPDAAVMALRAAIAVSRTDPFVAKDVVIRQLLLDTRSAAMTLIPEVAHVFNLKDAQMALASAARDALHPLDPYEPGLEAVAGRAVAAVLATFPSLFGQLLAAAGSDAEAQAVAGDLMIAAFARHGVVPASALATASGLVAATPDELGERLRPADNRYSTTDKLGEPRIGSVAQVLVPLSVRRSLRRLSFGFRVRLVILLLLDVAAVVLARELLVRLDPNAKPVISLGEALTAAGFLVALHVLAVETASGALPSGMVPAVAWPARLVSAYLIAGVTIVAALLPGAPDQLVEAAALALFLHLPLVAKDLVSKSDARLAVDRVARDRAYDFTAAGADAARAFLQRRAVREVMTAASTVRRATAEPVTRRRLLVPASRDGYVAVEPGRIGRVDRLLVDSGAGPLQTASPATLVLLEDPGAPVSVGDTIAVVEVDEPDLGRRALRATNRAIAVKRLPPADRARDAVVSLAHVLNRQVEQDRRGADQTSRRIEELIARFLSAADDSLKSVDPSDDYLGNVLPLDPEMEAVRALEADWLRAVSQRDETARDILRDHGLRLAALARSSRYSASLDFLIARLDVAALSTAGLDVHSSAALISELAGLAAEQGKHKSFFPARSALEGLLDRLASQTPLPREEELVRQRFEELLARGLVADYFLEVQVERGCRKLVAMSTAAATPRRKLRINFGLAKIGALALTSQRVALAARIAFLLRDAGLDLAATRALAGDESYALRMSTLSDLAGGVFGSRVGPRVVEYLAWVETVLAQFPLPATVTER